MEVLCSVPDTLSPSTTSHLCYGDLSSFVLCLGSTKAQALQGEVGKMPEKGTLELVGHPVRVTSVSGI